MKTLNVVHLSLTPLAAAPIRQCKALNLLEGVNARLVQFNEEGYGKYNFEKDLIWEKDKKLATELIMEADILHFHNYVRLDSMEFSPIDFKKLWSEGKPIIRQFHSNPELIARMTNMSPDDVSKCPLPKLTLGQYHERYYPTAKIIPNVVFFPDKIIEKNYNVIRIGYSPSNYRSSYEHRWDTKGYPETVRVLKKFIRYAKKNKKIKIEVDIITGVDHAECLRRKQLCHITIDDLVTGSYHMSCLESLSLGSVALTFMDDRVIKTVKDITGRDDFPAINTRLEDLCDILYFLVCNPKVVEQLGKYSFNWMCDYWKPTNIATQLVGIYNEVILNPKKEFDPRFKLDTENDWFMNQGIYDFNWKCRQKYWPKRTPKLFHLIKSRISKIVRSI